MSAMLDGNVTDQNGVPVAGALIYVYEHPGGLADLQDALGQPATNPVVAGEDGYWSAYAETDRYYTLKYSWGGRIRYVEANVLLGESVLGIQTDPNLRTELAAATGASLVTTKATGAGAVARPLDKVLEDAPKSVKTFGALANYSNASGTGTNDAAAFNAAFSYQSTAFVGAYQVTIPTGRYALSGTGARILEIQDGTYLKGDGALESIDLRVLDGSTALSVIEDDGSGAKIEMRNVQINGRNNPNLTAIVRLGVRGVQFGTYGYLDTLMARGGPNATAYHLGVNIQAMGDLYSIDTKDGVITTDGSVGSHFKGIYPISFTGYGVRFGGIGDAVLQSEFEAPGNNSICAMQSRGGQLGIGGTIVSLAASAAVKTLFAYDPTYNAGMRMGPWFLIRGGTGATRSQFGDFVTTPAATGTASSIGTNTLTDTAKNWKRNQFKGGAIRITGGTGSGTWAEIASNTKDTITINTGAWTSVRPDPLVDTDPDPGDTYALDYACKAVNSSGVPTGAGHMSSHSLTLPDAVILDFTAEKGTFNEVIVGSSNDARRLTQHLSVTATLDFASIAAGSVGAGLTVTVRGAAANDDVKVTPPAAAAAQGIIYEGVVTGADTVTVYPKNITAGAIDPASGTFRVSVRQFA